MLYNSIAHAIKLALNIEVIKWLQVPATVQL